MNTLFVRLEGPLQAWGTRARWGERDSALEPTKSGVIGLIACALGWGLAQDTAISDLSRSLRFGVRVDRPGRLLVDYHTVVGGVLSAEGKIKITASTGERETVVSRRTYLADASFLAALQGPDDLIARTAEALQAPVWPPFLGRRSCPPTVPFFAGIGDFATLVDALRSQPLPADAPSQRVRAVIEQPPGQGIRRNDQIASLARRTYLPRHASDILLDIGDSREE